MYHMSADTSTNDAPAFIHVLKCPLGVDSIGLSSIAKACTLKIRTDIMSDRKLGNTLGALQLDILDETERILSQRRRFPPHPGGGVFCRCVCCPGAVRILKSAFGIVLA
jgi:hypothetical protein